MQQHTLSKNPIETIFISAMEEEAFALLAALNHRLASTYPETKIEASKIPFEFGDLQLISAGKSEYLVVTSGIGMVNAAAALSTVLTKFDPKLIVCVGSAGGLHPQTRVQDVIIGVEYINSRADATAFGYAPGQVPGSPESFKVTAEISTAVDAALTSCAKHFPEINTSSGTMLSSDAFVTDINVDATRRLFPTGLSADMESQAYAQVASRFKIPYVAVRGISDLCGTPEDQSISFHAELSDVASRAAKVSLELSAQFVSHQNASNAAQIAENTTDQSACS